MCMKKGYFFEIQKYLGSSPKYIVVGIGSEYEFCEDKPWRRLKLVLRIAQVVVLMTKSVSQFILKKCLTCRAGKNDAPGSGVEESTCIIPPQEFAQE